MFALGLRQQVLSDLEFRLQRGLFDFPLLGGIGHFAVQFLNELVLLRLHFATHRFNRGIFLAVGGFISQRLQLCVLRLPLGNQFSCAFALMLEALSVGFPFRGSLRELIVKINSKPVLVR